VTIREHIKRRFRDMLLVVVVAYAALQAIQVAVETWPEFFLTIPALRLIPLAPLVFWMLVTWFSVKLFRIPCPRCLNSLGRVGLAVGFGRPIRDCPHCRVSFDEPAEISTDQK
jgi:hypothetical protein